MACPTFQLNLSKLVSTDLVKLREFYKKVLYP